MLMQKWSGGTKLLKEINRKYVDDQGLEILRELCENDVKVFAPDDELGLDNIQFGNCSFTGDTIAMYEWVGSREFKAYNYSTKQVQIHDFFPTHDDTIMCFVDNLARPKFYAAITTHIFPEHDGYGSKPQYRLDSILEYHMAFFENMIEEELVYQFTDTDFLELHSDPVYKCIVSIMISASVEELEQNCPITCTKMKDGMPVQYKKKRDEL